MLNLFGQLTARPVEGTDDLNPDISSGTLAKNTDPSNLSWSFDRITKNYKAKLPFTASDLYKFDIK